MYMNKKGTEKNSRNKKNADSSLSAFSIYNGHTNVKNELLTQIKLELKHKNETQKKLTQSIKNNDVTICSGPAGTGKTLLSVFEALLLLKTQPEIYKEIKLVKSVTQLKNEDVGTLPGDEKEKLKFIMLSYLDAFYKLIGEGLTNKLIEQGIIKMEIFGAIRGRSFTNCIIIVDEFQNISHDNAKTFLTRFSDNTKVIALGDTGQIDLKNKKDSSLEKLVERIKLNPVDGVEVIEFNESETVRHRLTSYFINIFKEPEQEKPQTIKKEKKKESILLRIFKFFKKTT
jgi:phosphate starvation-inducible PhoH-like protein